MINILHQTISNTNSLKDNLTQYFLLGYALFTLIMLCIFMGLAPIFI